LTASPIDETVDTKLKMERIIQLMTEKKRVLRNSCTIPFVYCMICAVDTDHTSLPHYCEHLALRSGRVVSFRLVL
jgi:hypothetical protein